LVQGWERKLSATGNYFRDPALGEARRDCDLLLRIAQIDGLAD